MQAPNPLGWEVVHEPDFDAALFKLDPDARRCDEFVYGAIEIIARNPRLGGVFPGTHVWYLTMTDVPKVPPLVLYYTFEDTNPPNRKAYLLWIEKI